MKTANVAEFKNHLSQYLRVVQAGEPVRICSRNQLIAMLSPIEKRGKNRTKLGCGKGSACIKTDLTDPVFDVADWEMLKGQE